MLSPTPTSTDSTLPSSHKRKVSLGSIFHHSTIVGDHEGKWFSRRRRTEEKGELEEEHDNIEGEELEAEKDGKKGANLSKRRSTEFSGTTTATDEELETGGEITTRGEGEVWYFRVHHRYLPIVSGILCPFSVLLEIPGLTTRWYVKTEGYNVVETQPNSIVLDVGLAISMAFGIIANLALIHRFLEKRVRLSTIISIICLSIHDIINVIILITFGVVHRFNDGFTYGDSYWMTVAATVTSLICNFTLVIDFFREKEFTKNGSGLTEKQRSLVVAVMCLLCYIALGSLVFSLLLKLTYINSLYFTICTITSVGFGDITPTTLSSRIFSLPYDIFGLILLAFTIAQSRETIIESFEESYRHRRGILARRARERKVERAERAKERRERRERELEILKEREKEEGGGGSSFGSSTLSGGGLLGSTISGSGTGTGRGGAGARIGRELDMLDEKEVLGISSGKAWINRLLRRLGWMKPLSISSLPFSNPSNSFSSSLSGNGNGKGEEGGREMTRTLTANSIVQEEKYVSFRKQVQNEQRREFQLKIGIALALFFLFWFVGAAVFHFTENWDYPIALYFCFITFTTIGYGDYTPKTAAGRAFFVAWAMLGIATMTLLLSVVTESWSSRYRSSITSGKVKQTIQRVKAASLSSSSPSFPKSSDSTGADNSQANRKRNAARLLKFGEQGLRDEGEKEEVEGVEKLLEVLGEKVRGFNEHARYFMNGRTGDPPPSLRSLIDAAEEFEDDFILDRLHDHDQFHDNVGDYVKDGELGSGGRGDTRHFLFMISYERSFDSLLETTEKLSKSYKSHIGEELETLKALNSQLRLALQSLPSTLSPLRYNSDSSAIRKHKGVQFPLSPSDSPSLNPSHCHSPKHDQEVEHSLIHEGFKATYPDINSRPPGGEGDEILEEELIEEIDSSTTSTSSYDTDAENGIGIDGDNRDAVELKEEGVREILRKSDRILEERIQKTTSSSSESSSSDEIFTNPNPFNSNSNFKSSTLESSTSYSIPSIPLSSSPPLTLTTLNSSTGLIQPVSPRTQTLTFLEPDFANRDRDRDRERERERGGIRRNSGGV